MKTYQTILHPTDLTDSSRPALQKAYALAQENGARLILLNVREPQEVVEGEFGMIPPEPQPEDAAILREMDRLLPVDPSLKIESMVAHGVAAEEIVRAANETHSDLIVLASHGHRNFLTHWLHANVAEQVTKAAACEVLCVEISAREEPVFAGWI